VATNRIKGQAGVLTGKGGIEVAPIKSWTLDVTSEAIDVTTFGGKHKQFIQGRKEITLGVDLILPWQGLVDDILQDVLVPGMAVELADDGNVAAAKGTAPIIGYVTKVDQYYDPRHARLEQHVEIAVGGAAKEWCDGQTATDCDAHWLIREPEFVQMAINDRTFHAIMDGAIWDGTGQIGRKAMSATLTMRTLAAIWESDEDKLIVEVSDGVEFETKIVPVNVEWERGRDAATVTYALEDKDRFVSILVRLGAKWFIPIALLVGAGERGLKKPIPELKTSVGYFMENAEDGQPVVRMRIREGELCSTSWGRGKSSGNN